MFTWEQQRIAIWDPWFNGELCANLEKQRRGTLLYGLRRDCCKGRIHWRTSAVQSTVTSHWLSSGGLPLVELLLGRQETFPSPAEVLVSFPVGDASASLPVSQH